MTTKKTKENENIALTLSEEKLQEYLELLKDDKEKLSGLKEIKFNVFAKGKGIVNQEGSDSDFKKYLIEESNGKELNNVIIPKLKKFSLRNKEGKEYKKLKLFVTSHAFKEAMFNSERGLKNSSNLESLLLSKLGLLNGYIIPSQYQQKPTSAILTDFETGFNNLLYEKTETQLQDLFKDKSITTEVLKNNGEIQIVSKTKSEGNTIKKEDKEDKSNNFYYVAKTLMENVFYHAEGVIFVERLQFIGTGAELGKQHAINSFNKENGTSFCELFKMFLNSFKEETLSYFKDLNDKKYAPLIKLASQDIDVEFGSYRYAGNLNQLIDKNVQETGFKFNSSAVALLILAYFKLMLSTKIYRGVSNYLETTNVEFADLEEDLKIADFYIKVED